MEKLTITDGFQSVISQGNSNNIITCLDCSAVWGRYLSKFEKDYQIFVEWQLESFDIASRIFSLPQTPFPETSFSNSNSENAAAIHQRWSNYPRIELQIHTAYDSGQTRARGQQIVIQNNPINFPVSALNYLTSGAVRLLGKNHKIAVQVLPTSDPLIRQLSASDQITVSGEWKMSITAIEKSSTEITAWMPIGIDLTANTATQILPENPNRRNFWIQNQGISAVRLCFGTFNSQSLNNNQWPILNIGGSLISSSFEKTELYQSVWALALDGNSRITGMEGLA